MNSLRLTLCCIALSLAPSCTTIAKKVVHWTAGSNDFGLNRKPTPDEIRVITVQTVADMRGYRSLEIRDSDRLADPSLASELNYAFFKRDHGIRTSDVAGSTVGQIIALIQSRPSSEFELSPATSMWLGAPHSYVAQGNARQLSAAIEKRQS